MTEQGRFAKSHQLLGTLFELALTPVEILVRVEPQLLSKAPQADVLLLRRAGSRWSAAQRARLPDGVRDSAASHVLVEFKYTESVNPRVLSQAVGYDHFYLQGQKLREAQLLTVVLSAKSPQARRLAQWGYEAEQPGVYRSASPLLDRVLLLVLNEMPAAPHNAFVKLFASRGREQEAAFEALKPVMAAASAELQTYVVGLQETLGASGGITMDEVITPEMVMERGKRWQQAVIQTVPAETLLERLAPEQRRAVIQTAPAEERLAGLKPEQRQAVMQTVPAEERVAGLAPEQRLSGMSEAERRSLLQLLLADTALQEKR